MKQSKLVAYLDDYLCIKDFEGVDISLNGLQVGGEEKEISHVAFAVDACRQSIERAIVSGADMLVVHHGLFWGKPIALVGSHGKRVKAMLDGNLDLYAAHLPLDAHPEVGNNIAMAKVLGLEGIEPFSLYKGKAIGVVGMLKTPDDLDGIAEKLGFSDPKKLDFNKGPIRKVAIVSGEGADDIYEAKVTGCDLLITGESRHSTYHWCEEEEISMLCGGHYATEVFGVKELALHLMNELQLVVSFIDVPTGL
jgi:dinuclear metal center YbgI/SA1388 family protein